MATEKRLIDANALLRIYKKWIPQLALPEDEGDKNGVETCIAVLEDQPTVDAVELPCKIGDFVWAIRSFHGHKHPQRGIVSDMHFLKDMSLQIVVKYVARGKWGETVFATYEEAYAAIGERKNDVSD